MKEWVVALFSLAVLAVASNAYAGPDTVKGSEPDAIVVPEIDAASAVTALCLLVGGLALAAERIRGRK